LCPVQHRYYATAIKSAIYKTHFIDFLLTKFEGIMTIKQLSIKVQITESNETMKIKDFLGRERRDHLVGQSSVLHLWQRQYRAEKTHREKAM